MFHGNFWSNVEMNLETGELEEYDSGIRRHEDLYRRTDPDWRHENLKDDLALQLYLLKRGKLATVEWQPLKRLAAALETDFNPDAERIAEEAGKLLDSYAYATVRCILAKIENFAEANGKQLMVLFLDPSGAMDQLLRGETRPDQEIVDYLKANQFRYFDMNEVHAAEYRSFNLDVPAYYKRYFIGHYNQTGTHFLPTRWLLRWSSGWSPNRLPTGRFQSNRLTSKTT